MTRVQIYHGHKIDLKETNIMTYKVKSTMLFVEKFMEINDS